MRKLFSILVPMAIGILLTATVWAQSPEKISYQAVIRNSSDVLVTNTQIGMEINIRQGTPSGTVAYTETQTPITNVNGLVSIEIGGGTGFNTIDWSAGPYFIETKTAVVPPLTTYTITGTSQLLSVPYALHSKTAETLTGNITETDPIFGASVASGITGTDTTNWNNKQDQLVAGTNITIVGNTISATCGSSSNDFYLGQDTLGGIVFYIYLDANGDQHGLIVSKTESTGTWSGSTLVGANRTEDGAYNTNLMPAGSTAKTWVTALGAGWYLPSIDELSLLWNNRFHVNKTARVIGAMLLSTTAYYWSSTETNASDAFYFCFLKGTSYSTNKTNTYSVRAVRAF